MYKMTMSEYQLSLSLKSTICGLAAGTKQGRRTRRKLLAKARDCEKQAKSCQDGFELARLQQQADNAREAMFCGAPRTYQGHPGETRTLLLAYAWLRGRSWNRVEPKRTRGVSQAHLTVQMSTWLTRTWTPKVERDRIDREITAWLTSGDKSRHDLVVPEPAKPAKPSLLARAHALLVDAA